MERPSAAALPAQVSYSSVLSVIFTPVENKKYRIFRCSLQKRGSLSNFSSENINTSSTFLQQTPPPMLTQKHTHIPIWTLKDTPTQNLSHFCIQTQSSHPSEPLFFPYRNIKTHPVTESLPFLYRNSKTHPLTAASISIYGFRDMPT